MILLSPGGDTVARLEREPDRLLVGTVDGVALATRSDDGWRPLGRGLPGCFVSAITRLRSGRLIAGTHGVGLAVSDDDGASWRWSNHGITCHQVWAVRALELDGRELVFAGTMPAHLFRSEDVGEHWEECRALTAVPSASQWSFPPQPRLGHVKEIAAFQGSTLLVGIEVGALLRSDDGGGSFTELPVSPDPSGIDMHRILLHPDRPQRIVCCTGGGMVMSEDGGKSWQGSPAPPDLDYPDPAVVHPDDPDLIFVAGGVGWPHQWYQRGRAQGKIARSRDGGRSWERLLGGLPDGQRATFSAMSLAVWPGGSCLLAADTDGQIFESRDGGDRWQVIAETAPVSKGGFYRGLAKGRGPLADIDDIRYTDTQLAAMGPKDI